MEQRRDALGVLVTGLAVFAVVVSAVASARNPDPAGVREFLGVVLTVLLIGGVAAVTLARST